jgi:hypothetical protein
MGPDLAKQRLRELGATDADFDALLYVEPDRPPTLDDYGLLDGLTLAIFDAAAGAYDTADLEDGKRRVAERFAALFIRPLWHRGVATILIDHVTKAKDTRGRYSIGSERKLGGADVHVGFEVIKPLRRGSAGLMRIVTHKDRFGHLARPRAGELDLRSDPVTHAITWTFRTAVDEETGDTWRPTVLMERVSRYLEGQPTPISRSQVENNLDLDGYATEEDGARGAHLLHSRKPFREVDLVPTSSRSNNGDLVPTSSPRLPLSHA